MAERPAVVTGFAPYGGRGINPAAEIARALAGRRIAGVPIEARLLEVSRAQIRGQVERIVAETDPLAVIGIGLWPGEPIIRIERIGINVADFEIPDNDGARALDEPLAPEGATASLATVPVRAIETALLESGIPARISSTAGTFLCNACLYHFLAAAAARPNPFPCGFLHVPYLPEQVADLLRARREKAHLELHQRADLASMELTTALRAVETALAVTIGAAREARQPA